MTLDRRQFLASAGAGVGALAFGLDPAAAASSQFRHGVASGDPRPSDVLLWTRVTPTAASTPGSGVGPTVSVSWQVARDWRFTQVVSSGVAQTGPSRDHTVKVVAGGLAPATSYYYRFVLDGVRSPTGRTRTAPAPTATPSRLRFGVVSCSNYQAGFFASYRHLAARRDLDAVLHLGDYLYEYGPGEYGYGNANTDVRPHQPAHEITTLRDYRQRHAQYKTDPDLQALHVAAPWIVTWDDHESANDAYDGGAENHTPGAEGTWPARRAAAYRAYDEWMPVRLGETAALDDGTQIYRRLRFGRLAELSMLDLRTYRSQQVGTDLAAVDDPARTIAGDPQLRWLKESLASDAAQWKLVGNPVMIAPLVFPPLPADLTRSLTDVTGLLPPEGVPYNVDQWDGYTADRREILRHLADQGITDSVFITGDIHSAWANDLPLDAGTYPLSRSVGTEFVCTSVTSNNLDDIVGVPPRTSSLAVEAAITATNRHVRYVDFDSHGYSVLDVTPARVQMDYYVIGDRASAGAGSHWSTSWATSAGSQRVRPVSAPVA
ncbi:MAG: twin-arginine translocation signal domain-containing protein [Propionibacteriales bacterium]|nr:twin-arginine translocation signal domain-containing protein [Propionibacteriales bacterium]